MKSAGKRCLLRFDLLDRDLAELYGVKAIALRQRREVSWRQTWAPNR
jgi:hypothetical protein